MARTQIVDFFILTHYSLLTTHFLNIIPKFIVTTIAIWKPTERLS